MSHRRTPTVGRRSSMRPCAPFLAGLLVVAAASCRGRETQRTEQRADATIVTTGQPSASVPHAAQVTPIESSSQRDGQQARLVSAGCVLDLRCSPGFCEIREESSATSSSPKRYSSDWRCDPMSGSHRDLILETMAHLLERAGHESPGAAPPTFTISLYPWHHGTMGVRPEMPSAILAAWPAMLAPDWA